MNKGRIPFLDAMEKVDVALALQEQNSPAKMEPKEKSTEVQCPDVRKQCDSNAKNQMLGAGAAARIRFNLL